VPTLKNNHLGEGNPELANGRYYNIIEAMHKSFNYDIGEEMRQYIKEGPNSVRRVTGKDDARCFQLVNWQINAVFSQYGRPVNAMIFDAIVGCKLAVCTSIEGVEMYDEVTEADFDLRFVLDMTCPGGRIWPPRIVPAKDAFRGMALCQGIPMNEYFEPVLRTNEDYDRFARMMLSVYNERALTRPTIIRGTDLAKQMGLKIRYVGFALEKDVKARTYFVDTREALLDDQGKLYYEIIKPGTILVNVARLRSEEDQNTTIIHECVHVFKDYYFFMIQRMAGMDNQLYTSRRIDGVETGSCVIDTMEEQAERLPAFIMMPAETTKAFIEEELEELGGFHSPTNMRVIAMRLSLLFGVSMLMARNRMIELGYPEAKGVCQYVAGKEVPSHGCTKGWAKDVVFQISMENATGLFNDNPEFEEAVAKRRYVYVGGFYVISSTRYVQRDEDGALSLTQEALQHMERCCVAFSKGEKAVKHISFRNGAASRSMTKAERAQLGLKAINLPVVEEMDDEERLFKDEEKWDKLLDDMHDSIPCALDAILAMTGLSKRALSDRLGIAKSNIDKWYRTGKIPKGQIAAICLELELRGDIGNKLATLSGIRWDAKNKKDVTLRMFINHQESFSIVTADEYMVNRNFGTLYPRAELTSIGA